MQGHGGGMEPYGSQQEVDAAFAEYDRALLTVRADPALQDRNSMLCVSCGGVHYCYNTSAGGEPGSRVCTDCGVVRPGPIIFEQMYGRTIPSRTSNYKRIHHWHERISQFMLLESPIPSHQLLQIGERLLDGTHPVINKDVIREVLRALGLQIHIEKWLSIMERTTGIAPPIPGPTVLAQLDTLFLELQRPFNAAKPANRRNFCNYNYTFCRIFQLMGCTKFCMFFPLIRSKVKLRQLNEIWDAMATSIGWPTPPLIHVEPFAVRVHEPATLLSRLRQRVAQTDSVVPASVPPKTEFRKWDRQTAIWLPPKRPVPRSEPLEQGTQKLALRLKRRRKEEA